jgi:hypothetical protein
MPGRPLWSNGNSPVASSNAYQLSPQSSKSILGQEVAVDQAVAIGRVAEGGELLARAVARLEEYLELRGGQAVELPEGSPGGLLAHQGGRIERRTLELPGPLPTDAVLVHPGRQLSQGAVAVGDRPIVASRSLLQAAERFARHPAQQVALSGLGDRRRARPADHVAGSRGDHLRGADARLGQGAHPVDLRADLCVTAIAGSVDA